MGRPKKETHFFLIVYRDAEGACVERYDSHEELEDAYAGWLSAAVPPAESDIVIICGGELMAAEVNRKPTVILTSVSPKRTRKPAAESVENAEMPPKRKGWPKGKPRGPRKSKIDPAHANGVGDENDADVEA